MSATSSGLLSDMLPQIGDWESLDELADLQREHIPQVLARAGRVPFYRDRFGPGAPPTVAEDLQSVPPTTKQDLREQYPFGLLAVHRSELATYHESSGTAGQATPSYYTAADWVDLAERFARKWVGIGAEDTLLVRTPYALMITGHLAQVAARSRGATVVPADYRSLVMPYSRLIRVLHDLDVTLTWSIPTEPIMWAAAARAAGLRPDRDFPHLRALFVGGEPLSAARRRRIEHLWGVPAVEEYGSTETGSLAGECRRGVMHLWSDRFVFEVRDRSTGRIGREGRGTLVVTPLFREAMPLLRYDLEDDVEVSYDECGCGWVLPTVRVLGRAALTHEVAGRPVTQNDLEDVVFDLPAELDVLFWRARAEASVLRVEIEVEDRHRAAAIAGLEATLPRRLGVPATVGAVAPGTLVPREVLTGAADVIKPRTLLGPGEGWAEAKHYR